MSNSFGLVVPTHLDCWSGDLMLICRLVDDPAGISFGVLAVSMLAASWLWFSTMLERAGLTR